MADTPFDFDIPVGEGVEAGVDWTQDNLTGLLDGVADGLGVVIDSFDRITLSFGRKPSAGRGKGKSLLWGRVRRALGGRSKQNPKANMQGTRKLRDASK